MQRVTLLSLLFLPIVTMTVAQTAANSSDPTEKHEAAQSAASADVREAVLRYQISTWHLVTAAYCVKIDGKDADQSFLNRFQSLPVEEGSACRRQTLPGLPKSLYTTVDAQTEKSSVIFEIGKIRWTKPQKADVEGSYECGSQVNGNGTYHVEWDGTHWAVTSFDERGASVTLQVH